jgi:hypothetical protein
MWRARNFVQIVEQLWGVVPSLAENVVQRILPMQNFVLVVGTICRIHRKMIPISVIYRKLSGEDM